MTSSTSYHANLLSEIGLEGDGDDTAVRTINAITRSALIKTAVELFGEPLNISRLYRYFETWITRAQFYNFLQGRRGCSFDRCLGLLIVNRKLRVALELDTLEFDERQCEYLHRLTLQSGIRGNWLAWLSTTLSSDMSTHLPQAFGVTNSEQSL